MHFHIDIPDTKEIWNTGIATSTCWQQLVVLKYLNSSNNSFQGGTSVCSRGTPEGYNVK